MTFIDPTEDQPDPHEIISKLCEELEEKARKIGLYYNGSNIGTDTPETAQMLMDRKPIREIYANNGRLILQVSFNIGDLAFDPQVTNPEQTEFDREARKLLPTKGEMMRDKIKQALAEGKDITDIFDGDDDGTDETLA